MTGWAAVDLGLRWVGIICCFVVGVVFRIGGGIWLRYF